jgi:hypothetical protein
MAVVLTNEIAQAVVNLAVADVELDSEYLHEFG